MLKRTTTCRSYPWMRTQSMCRRGWTTRTRTTSCSMSALRVGFRWTFADSASFAAIGSSSSAPASFSGALLRQIRDEASVGCRADARILCRAFVIGVLASDKADSNPALDEFGTWMTWIAQNFTWLYIGTQVLCPCRVMRVSDASFVTRASKLR